MKSPLFTLLVASLLATRMHAEESAVKAPPLAEMKAQPAQGLTLTFQNGNAEDARRARLASLEIPSGAVPSPFVPAGGASMSWSGAILAELRAEYTFAVEAAAGSVKMTVNGEDVALETIGGAPGKPVQLKKGANALVLTYVHSGKANGHLRLFWKSKEFGWEPVPPTVFQTDVAATALRKGERLRKGRLLFAQMRCAACHEAAALLPAKGEGMPELAQDAPIFAELHTKFREAWLAAWINDPHSIRPHALMPRVFADGKAGAIDQRAADLAAYFVSQGAPPEAKPLDESLAVQGGALFANLGCIACHTKPDADGKDEYDRVPLAHVRAKWHAPALRDYLQDPVKNFAWSRMPNFRLTDDEATKLAAYLLLDAKWEAPKGPKGDAARGAQLLATSGCLNCHAGMPPTTTPALAATMKGGWKSGCMAADAAARGKAPDFGFTASQREALTAFAAEGLGSLKQDSATEFAERQIANLRCTACHARDGQASVWSRLDDETAPLQAAAPIEEGEGKPVATTAIPQLTWFGEKLQPAWMAEFIAGRGKYKPRPWIVGRMPGFAAVAEGISKGLSLEHGLPVVPAPLPPPDKDKVKAGATLVSENGGFNCVQCHALGERPATAVFEAPAPNLAYVHERIRKEYFDRWLLFPLRVDAETKMPKFADDAGKTPLTDFYGGKASEQYDAIWQYLQTFKK